MTDVYRLPSPADQLFEQALLILDDAGTRYGRPFPWTLGGGTVLAMRHDHRASKDIDIFLRDPQYLGYVTPRLSDVASERATDYEEGAEYVKIRYAEGEIDFVVASSLTVPGVEEASLAKRTVLLETDEEIVAKKLHYRGHRFQPRDLFDLAMVLAWKPQAESALAPFLRSAGLDIRQLLATHPDQMRIGFEAINTRRFTPAFEDASALVLSAVGRACS